MTFAATSGPELTLHQSVKFVAAAYIVFLVIVLTYVAIMAVRQRRTERALAELRRELVAREQARDVGGVPEAAPRR